MAETKGLKSVQSHNARMAQANQAFAAQAREQLDRAAQMTFSGVGSGVDISPTPTTKRWPSLMERATNRERIYNDMKDEFPQRKLHPALLGKQTTAARIYNDMKDEIPDPSFYVSASGLSHQIEGYDKQIAAQKTDEWKAKQAEYDQQIWELEEQARNYSAAGMTDKYLEIMAEVNRVKTEKAMHGDSVGRLEAQRGAAAAQMEATKASDWEIMIADQIKRTGKEDLMDKLLRISELDGQIELYQTGNAAQNGMPLPSSPAQKQAEAERQALYSELRGIYGDVVATWLAYADRVRNRENAEAAQTAIAQMARDNPFWSSVATIPANVASGAGFLDVAGQKLNRWVTGSDVPVDYNTPAMMVSKGVNTARQAVGEEIAKDTQGWIGSDTKLGNLYSGGYQLLMSLADTGVSALTGSQIFLGGAAATSAMTEAKERGATDNQALLIGVISGVLEGLMEKHSIGNLLNMTTDGARSAVRNILKQAVIEGSEEFNTTLANTIADQLIMGDKNQMATRARELMALGYSAQRAEEMAKAEFRNSLMADALGGMISGGVFAGVGSAGQMVGNRLANRTTTQKQTQTAPAVQQPQAAPATVAESATVPQTMDTDRAAVDQAAQMTFAAAEPIAPETYRQTAAQILDEGIFESPKYGPALQQTGLSRGEIRQALRSVSRGVMAASVDPNVQTVLRAIQQADNQPVIAQEVVQDVQEPTEAMPEAPAAQEIPTAQEAPRQPETVANPAAVPQMPMEQPAQQQPVQTPPVQPNVEPVQPGSGANGSVGDMGAKTSAFPHEVKQSQTATNTIGKNEDRWNVPEDARVDASYDAVTEQESLNNARMRLEQDAAGEMEHLRNSSAWNSEDVDVSMLILGGLRQKAKEDGDWSQFKEWAKVVKQHGVTAGQALQAWAKYTRMTADGVMNIVAQNLENARKGTDVDAVLQLTSEMADKFEALNTSKDIDGLVQMIKDTSNVRRTGTFFGNKISKQMNWALNHVAEMARQDPDGKAYEFLRNFAAAGIEDIAGDHMKVSAGKVIKTIRYNSMLSKAATVLRNLVGNGVMDVTDTFARDISVPLDMLLSTITKTRSVAVDKSWISDAKRKGSVDAFAMALMETGLDVNASGASNRYEQTANRTAKMSGGVMERLLSSWEKWTAYNLNVTDEIAKGGTAAEVQRGIDKLYERGKIKDDSLRDAGQQEALYRTFQDENALSGWVGDLRQKTNERFKGAGDYVLPFTRVPSNLVVRAYDYSPAGLLASIGELVNVMHKAKQGTLTAAEQAKAVQSFGRGVTGSTIITALTGLALKGLIHVTSPGDEEENKEKAAQEKNQGFYGTQFNLFAAKRWMQGGSAEWQEGDQLLSIGFLEPFNAHMNIAALIAEDIKNGTVSGWSVAEDTATGLWNALLELPVMSAVRDATEAYRYSNADSGAGRFIDAATQYGASLATSFIPNALKGIAQGLDPMQRDLYTSETEGGQLLDQVKSSIPGLRNTLPEKLDSYGRPMENEGGVKNFLNATVNPGAVTTYHEDEVEAATRMLAEDTGRASVYAERKPPNHLTVDGEQIQLDVDQRRGYQQTRGQTEHETKAALNADDTFTGLDRGLQADAFETAETYSKEIAKSGLGLGYEPPKWVKDLEGKSQEEVIDAIIQKTLENADGYGDADLAAALSMTVEDGLSSDLARESQDQAQAYADAVYRYELGYTDVPDWVETAMQMTTDQQREKYLAAVAAGNYAEATYGKKYDGLEQMLSEGQITDEVALLACSNSVQTAYRDACKGKGISAEQFIDVYGYAVAHGDSAEGQREAGLKYIEGLNLSEEKATALSKGLYSAIKKYVPVDPEPGKNWLAEHGTDEAIIEQMSDDQRIAYNTYIRGSGIGLTMDDYLDVKNFDDVDGHDTKMVQNYIEANYPESQWKALYLSLGYKTGGLPKHWK